MGNLYIISTPIGNLQDITLRAIESLFSVDLVYSERPQKTLNLLSNFLKLYPGLVHSTKIPKIISMNEFEEESKIFEVITRLEQGLHVALVSEAGTPLLSDPGYKLVCEVVKRSIRVIPIPGVSSITTALSVSALPTDSFWFLGFLPKRTQKKRNELEKLKICSDVLIRHYKMPTIVIFESPHRLAKTLEVLQSVFGDIYIVVAKELTKMHETVYRGVISKISKQLSESSIKGEYVILFSLKS